MDKMSARHGKHLAWEIYRRETGACETCHQTMKKHNRCESCLILCGIGHTNSCTSLFREKQCCDYCISAWERRDNILGRPTAWEEFLKGIPASL